MEPLPTRAAEIESASVPAMAHPATLLTEKLREAASATEPLAFRKSDAPSTVAFANTGGLSSTATHAATVNIATDILFFINRP